MTTKKTLPKSLKQLCMDSLLPHRRSITTTQPQGRLTFRDPSVFIPQDVAEDLLEFFSSKGFLDDDVMALFGPRHTLLKHVVIPWTMRLSIKGLAVLRQHTLQSLEIGHSRSLNVQDVLDKLGSHSLARLQRLSISNSNVDHLWIGITNRHRFLPKVLQPITSEVAGKLVSLTSLAVKNCNICSGDLKTLADNVPGLRSLDLSANDWLTDIAPLVKYEHQLTSLTLCDVHLRFEATKILLQLCHLTHLDVSWTLGTSKANMRNDFFVASLLRRPSSHPRLVSLDVSGREDPPEDLLSDYLTAHPTLKFLGLWGNEACRYQDIRSNKFDLTVTGHDTVIQARTALRHYCSRDCVAPAILECLPSFTNASAVEMGSILDDVVDYISTFWDGCSFAPGQDPQFVVMVRTRLEPALSCLYHLVEPQQSASSCPFRADVVQRLTALLRRVLKAFPGPGPLVNEKADNILQCIEQ